MPNALLSHKYRTIPVTHLNQTPAPILALALALVRRPPVATPESIRLVTSCRKTGLL